MQLLTFATVTMSGTAAVSRRVPDPGSSLSSSSGSPSPPSPYSTSTPGSFVSASAACADAYDMDSVLYPCQHGVQV